MKGSIMKSIPTPSNEQEFGSLLDRFTNFAASKTERNYLLQSDAAHSQLQGFLRELFAHHFQLWEAELSTPLANRQLFRMAYDAIVNTELLDRKDLRVLAEAVAYVVRGGLNDLAKAAAQQPRREQSPGVDPLPNDDDKLETGVSLAAYLPQTVLVREERLQKLEKSSLDEETKAWVAVYRLHTFCGLCETELIGLMGWPAGLLRKRLQDVRLYIEGIPNSTHKQLEQPVSAGNR
jgi:hypothetical protein